MKVLSPLLILLFIPLLLPSSFTDSNPFSLQSRKKIDPLDYDVEVELVQIPARVVSKNGEWVSGLTAEDFELFEDGKKQSIQSVDQILAGELPESTQRKIHPNEESSPQVISDPHTANNILLLIDGTSTGKTTVEKHKKYLIDFLKKYSAPNTQFSLILLKQTGSYEVLQPLTSDKSLIIKGIERLQGSIAGMEERTTKAFRLVDPFAIEQCISNLRLFGLAGIDCTESALRSIVVRANSYAIEEQNRTFMALRSIQKFFETTRHMPGQKSVILVSEGWDPGGIFYQNYAANAVEYFINRYALPSSLRSILKESKLDAERIGSGIQQIRDLVRFANASGLTIYWVNPDYGNHAGNGSVDLEGPSRLDFKYYNSPDIERTMQGIAEDTGGWALASYNITRFYEQIASSIPQYYLLHYKPHRPVNDGKFHRIDIQLKEKNHGYRISYKKDLWDSPFEERITGLLAEMHDFPGTSDLKIQNEVSYFLKSNDKYRILIRTAVPYTQIEPKLNGELVQDKLHFSFLIRSKRGEVVLQTHPVLEVVSSRNKFEELQKANAYLEYTQSSELKSGNYDVSVVVMDAATSKLAETSMSVELPKPHGSCFSISPVLLASAASPAKTTVAIPVSNEKGHIHYGNQNYHFSIRRLYPPSGSLSGFYQIYNASLPSIFVAFKLYRDSIFINQTNEREITSYTDPDQKLISNFFSVPYKNLPPGSYEFEVTARDSSSQCISASRISFGVIDSGG